VAVVGVKDGVREKTDPKPQRGELLVRVHAISLNYCDIAIPLGRYPRNAILGLIPTRRYLRNRAAAALCRLHPGTRTSPADRRDANF
jgi:hypothetical protein